MNDWLRVRLTVDRDRVDDVESALFAVGAAAVSLLDGGNDPVHEPAPGRTPIWPRTAVEGLFPASFQRSTVLDALRDRQLVCSPEAVEFASLAGRDWTRAWMDRYQPMRFGRSLWICPSHLRPDPDWPVVIRLDPGLAFGSGTHPTTALCLEWIDSRAMDGLRILDYGCGSGVLGIAGALSGAARVVAVDHDPQALQATAENAARNGLDGRIDCRLPESFDRSRKFDLVLANILAGPLISLAPRLTEVLEPGGQLVLSGLLPEQADDVMNAYALLGQPLDRSVRDGWMRLVFAVPRRRHKLRTGLSRDG